MFGNSFGRGTSAFGQSSTFGKPTTGFSNTTFGTPGSSMFGQTSQPSTNLFGSTTTPAFGGQNNTTSSFGTFGSNTNSLFGGGQQNTSGMSGGLFGAPNTNANTTSTGLFGSSGTSAFGQSFGFGANTGSNSIFGQNQTTPQSSSIFGQPSGGTTSLFGTTAGAFGGTAGTTGTPFKFIPPTGSDSVVKNGATSTINTKHNCITCMKEYETKSIEELRYEDYLANRKGPQSGTQSSTLFGGSGSSTLFGTNPPASTSGGIFGSSNFGQSNVFGQPTTGLQSTSGGGLFGKTTSAVTPFGATTTTQSTGFGSFNQTPSLFGSNTAQTKSAFGTTQPGGLFGSSTTGTTAFGTQQPSFGFGTPQTTQAGGLFQQPQNKFPFGTASTSTFTFGTNTTSSNTSLFGKPTGTAFGMPSSTTASTFGTGTFGTTSQPSLFGSGFNKPQTNTFSFGSTNTTGIGTGTSLFGTNTKPVGNLFGNTASGNFGTGGFGTGNATFGTGPNSTFGNPSSFANSLGSNPGMNTAQPAGSASFNEQLQMLTTLPFGDSPLFKRIFPSDKISEVKTIHKSPDNIIGGAMISDDGKRSFRVSLIDNSVIKRTPKYHYQDNLFEGLEDMSEKNLFVQKSNPRHLDINKILPENDNDAASVIDRGASILREENTFQNVASSVSTRDNNNRVNYHVTFQLSKESDDSVVNGKLDEDLPKIPPPRNESTPVKNLKSLSIEEITTPVEKLSEKKDDLCCDKNNEDVTDSELENTSKQLCESSLSDVNEGCDINQENTVGVILTKPNYYTIPLLSELSLDGNGRCIVSNFSIGVRDVGNVIFLEPVNVAGLNLDEIVNITYKEVDVYPDEKNKPAIGSGLNTKALVTLDRIWPIDKTTRELIKDVNRIRHLKFEEKLKKSCIKTGSEFVEYRPGTGSYVFEVKHFSKYGLIDDSDDDEDNLKELSNKNSTVAGAKGDVLKTFKEHKQTEDIGQFGAKPSLTQHVQLAKLFSDKANSLVMDAPLDYEDIEPMIDDSGYENYGVSPKLNKDLNSSYLKLRLLKSSLYLDELDAECDMDVDLPLLHTKKSKPIDQLYTPLFKSQFITPEVTHTDHGSILTSTQILEPKTVQKSTALQPDITVHKYPIIRKPSYVVIKFKNSCVPFEDSILSSDNLQTDRDVCLMFGHLHRIGWSYNSTMITLASERLIGDINGPNVDNIYQLLSGRKLSDYTKNLVCISKMRISSQEYFQENVTNHLQICLKQSMIKLGDGVPLFVPKSGTKILNEHCILSRQIGNSVNDNYDRQVWELMVVLWGDIPDFHLQDNPFSHQNNMTRKNALSNWLEDVVQPTVDNELSEHDHIRSIMSLLSGHKIIEACNLAMAHKEYNLALQISQIGGVQLVRSLMADQLNEWRKTEADYLISHGRLKIMTLVAGETFFLFNKWIMNTCENLDWKRAFALHLWYITSPSDSLIDALTKYEEAFSDDMNKVKRPDPPYADTFAFENTSGENIQDLCFHLLKLYSFRSHPLIKLLNPITHTTNVLDYRLSWFVMMTLKSLGYQHLLEEEEVHYHVNFASQLQVNGMWEWAIFVLLHIKNADRRAKAVLDIIDRNVELLSDRTAGLTEKEHFLTTHLKIPPEWIFSAKAVMSCFHKRYEEAAWYYIKAEKWNEAHDIVMKHLLSKAILAENYDTVEKLLGELILSEKAISTWNHRGSLIWDYLNISKRIEQLVKAEDDNIIYHLAQLQPLMVSVCENVHHLPSETVKDRLCQAEISKRMVQYVQTVITFQGQNATINRFIGTLANKLPLPEDYVQSELLQNISHFVNQ